MTLPWATKSLAMGSHRLPRPLPIQPGPSKQRLTDEFGVVEQPSGVMLLSAGTQ
jgi:hypothetical protein